MQYDHGGGQRSLHHREYHSARLQQAYQQQRCHSSTSAGVAVAVAVAVDPRAAAAA